MTRLLLRAALFPLRLLLDVACPVDDTVPAHYVSPTNGKRAW